MLAQVVKAGFKISDAFGASMLCTYPASATTTARVILRVYIVILAKELGLLYFRRRAKSARRKAKGNLSRSLEALARLTRQKLTVLLHSHSVVSAYGT
jgi:hypothetical protein